MKVGDLTTLTRLKAYIPNVPVSAADVTLARLITSVSNAIRTFTDREFAVAAYTETRDGRGNCVMLLDNTPIISITSLAIDGVAVQARPVLAPTMTYTSPGGYTFDERRVMLDGMYFSRGFQNVRVAYRAGFQVVDEFQTIPDTPGPYTLSSYRFWASDLGVKFSSSGVALTLVTGAPAANQYSVVEGLFTFNVADKAKGVLLSYGTVPEDVEECCIEMASERFQYRDRVGINSKSIEGQNISYMRTDMNDSVKSVLINYKKVGMTP